MKRTAYIAPKIFTGIQWLQQHALVVAENRIEAIIPAAEVGENDYNIKRFSGGFLAPAFIDIQIYGAGEKLLAVHPTTEALQLLADYCTAGGATLCVPTVATNSTVVFKQCIDAVRAYWSAGGKGVYGLHLEGPWINKEKRGAHLPQYIHAPTIEEVTELLQYGKDVVKIITLAPEVCRDEVVQYIQKENIIISAGHSNATYEQATEAFNKGITTATHLYNAMSALNHRQPGLVGALFNHATAMCSIIPDGHHVDYAAIRIAKKQMEERLFVITDAVTTTVSGPYQHQPEGDKYVCNGTLSGSALTMHKAFKNLVQHAGIGVEEALRMCSLYPAKILQQDKHWGLLQPGYRAEAIVLNDNLELQHVISA
ncbi:MAG: N-acetylglucosamine-6-phosphate deacetylase [Chitinophagaceae bacterium]